MGDNVSIYLIFTDHEELSSECKDDIFRPLVQAFEKIYTSNVVRLKVDKIKLRKLRNVIKEARAYAIKSAQEAIKDFDDMYKDNNPTVMALASKNEEHDWNWTIELRLGNSCEDSGFVSINTGKDLPDDVGYQ